MAYIQKVKREKSDNAIKKKHYSTKAHNESSVVPDFLKPFVTQRAWDQFSPIKRNSFKDLMRNPNSFFYRNRPPGEKQKYGGFTPEEERQFFERLKYFREILHIQDGLWGLFAVPFEGRFGYQCSNYYRLLISDGKIKDKNYTQKENGKLIYIHRSSRQVPSESLRKLEKEAFDYIQSCLQSCKNQPISFVPEPRGYEKTKRAKYEKKKVKILTYDDVKNLDVDPLHNLVNKDVPNLSGKKSETTITPIHFYPDSLTNEPIETPYLDTLGGIVLDKKTWELFFDGKISSNLIQKKSFNIRAASFNDLVLLNKSNFPLYYIYISNIPV